MLVLRGLCEQKLLTKVSGERRAQHKGRDRYYGRGLFFAPGSLSPFHVPAPQVTAAELSPTHHDSQRCAQSTSHSNQHLMGRRSLQGACQATTHASEAGDTAEILLFRGQSCRTAR